MKHLLNEVACTETCCFGTNLRAAELETLAGECAGMLVCEFLIHAKHVAHFTTANTYIACRDILVGANIAPQLKHESLAESHNLGIALTLGTEVGATFCATHGECARRAALC